MEYDGESHPDCPLMQEAYLPVKIDEIEIKGLDSSESCFPIAARACKKYLRSHSVRNYALKTNT